MLFFLTFKVSSQMFSQLTHVDQLRRTSDRPSDFNNFIIITIVSDFVFIFINFSFISRNFPLFHFNFNDFFLSKKTCGFFERKQPEKRSNKTTRKHYFYLLLSVFLLHKLMIILELFYIVFIKKITSIEAFFCFFFLNSNKA